jgi:hypothetical protein
MLLPMPKTVFPDFELLKMWPRKLLSMKEGGNLVIRKYVSQLERPAIYILYRDSQPIYIGRANRLISRLHSHANKATSKHYMGWDHFSAFVLIEGAKKPATELALLEAILIASYPGARNSAVPRFKLIRIPRAMRADLDPMG